MKFFRITKTAVTGITTHRSRSALTILGIVIGITAIMIVMSVGEGAQNLILDQIRGFGSQMIDIEPGRKMTGPSDFAQTMTDSLKERDIKMLEKVPGVQEVAPIVYLSASVAYEGETEQATILGSTDLYSRIMDIGLQEGSFFSQEEASQYSNAAVIGSEIKKQLFGDAPALKERIKIKDKTFRIVGVLEKKGKVSMMDVDKMVLIPYTTAQKYLLGINYYNGGILVQAENEKIVSRLVEEITYQMRELHDISDPSKDDFNVQTQADAMETVSSIMGILTALLSSVAAVSLVVGGIGIMNIMLVSVTERTREIGLRKALGATEKNILTQFLLESVMLTMAGGIIGIILGALSSYATSLILAQTVAEGWSFAFPIQAALLGMGVSATVGLIFGLYPAKKASEKSPIEALRYE